MTSRDAAPPPSGPGRQEAPGGPASAGTVQPTAPIALFVFRRPFHTLQTLYALSRCAEAATSTLYVFCDGPRSERDHLAVQHTREVVRAHRWPGRLEIIESDRNLGLSRSVIDGVTKLCREHGRVIVLEDDLLVAGGFLAYMNEALARYADEERVMTVSGHAFDAFEPEARAVFLPLSTTWGWATWSRAWAHFEEKPQGLKRLESPEVRRAFDLDGSYPYSEMMRAQLEGTIDSWGIRWYWTLWQRQGLGVFPLQSMIKNIGAGEGATHSGAVDPLLDTRSFGLDNRITSFPTVVAADEAAYRRWMEFIRVSRASGTEPPGVARFFGAARRLARRGASILRATLERREVG